MCDVRASEQKSTNIGSGRVLEGSWRVPERSRKGLGGDWEGSGGVPEGSGRGLGGVRERPRGSQDEAKRDKNTKERRQDDPGPPRPEFFPLWWPGWGRFWSPKSIKIAPKKHSNIDHFFDCFLDRFWTPKSIKKHPQNRSKTDPRSISKGSQKKTHESLKMNNPPAFLLVFNVCGGRFFIKN